jgi:hypothetical protein
VVVFFVVESVGCVPLARYRKEAGLPMGDIPYFLGSVRFFVVCIILTVTFHSILGYANIMAFAREQALGLLQQRIAYYQSRVDYFSAKYGYDYTTFC